MFRWIAEKVYNFVNNNLNLVFAFAIVGIIFAIVGHYGSCGFHLGWFLFFELPLYIFCGWAIYVIIKMLKNIK